MTRELFSLAPPLPMENARRRYPRLVAVPVTLTALRSGEPGSSRWAIPEPPCGRPCPPLEPKIRLELARSVPGVAVARPSPLRPLGDNREHLGAERHAVMPGANLDRLDVRPRLDTTAPIDDRVITRVNNRLRDLRGRLRAMRPAQRIHVIQARA